MPHANDSNNTLRLGILGCGRVTETSHLPALRRLFQSIQVVAVADFDEHRRRRVAGMFDIAQMYPDLATMLRDAENLDAIAVCVPVQHHTDAVIASLHAGKHVFVEKPLAANLDDADRIVATAVAHPNVKVMVGFNLRHHRLAQQARQMIADGVIGELHLVRSVWTSGIRSRTKLPPWRSRRQTGGGALTEIAIHHFDLIPFLAGGKIVAVFAKSRQGDSDDQTAAVVMQLDNGVTVSSAFSDLSGDSNEFELIGSKGRIAFSIYRGDSLTFSPAGTYPGIKKQLIHSLRQFPVAWRAARNGGDFLDSYRQEWLAFTHAIRNNALTTPTVEDGREALRAVLAAGASANLGRPVAIADAPRQPLTVEVAGRSTVVDPEPMDDPTQPLMSAILATRTDFAAIRRTVVHLRAQTIQNRIELVMICPDASQFMLDENEIKGFWGHQVLQIGPFHSVAQPNAAGIRAAKANVVALCEDHAFPDPQWAQSLVLAHRGPYAAVGPAIHNANPDTFVSRADMIIGYGPWAEPVKPGEMKYLPGHNSAYKRDILLSYGDRLTEMLEAETVLQWELCANGHRLYLDPNARLAHTNFAKLGIWNQAQFFAGRVFGGTRALNWPLWKRVLYMCASPLIPLVRMRRSWGHARRLNAAHRTLGVFLAVLWGLSLDGLGQMLGYITGPGQEKRRAHEFMRVNNITEQDRAQLADKEQKVSSRLESA